jgi:hypothetical protein
VCAAADTQEPDVAASFELMATGYSPESNLLARCAGPGRATPGRGLICETCRRQVVLYLLKHRRSLHCTHYPVEVRVPKGTAVATRALF